MNLKTMMVGLLASTASFYLSAYEPDTHAYITAEAWRQSVLAHSSPANELWVRLGLERRQPELIFRPGPDTQIGLQDNQYIDAEASWPNAGTSFVRPTTSYDGGRMQQAQSFFEESYRTIPRETYSELGLAGWLMRGTIREDDLESEFYQDDAPDADPHGEITRVYNHFYDPINNRGLSPFDLPCVAIGPCNPSIRWAVGVEDALAPSFAPHLNRRNHFSWLDARRFMLLALTAKPVSNELPPSTSAPQKASSRDRDFYWATTFKSLGHVVHLLQDLASPQHSRNDRHNHQCGGLPSVLNATFPRRIYEPYINWRLGAELETFTADCERDRWVNFFGNVPSRLPLVATRYEPPQFATPVRYFTTRHEQPDIDLRRGLADYANRNFFTEGTREGEFLRPERNVQLPVYSRVVRTDQRPDSTGTNRSFGYYREAPDPVRPVGFQDINLVNGKTLVASGSAWSDFFGPHQNDIQLSSAVFDAQADHLIPRAIGYSAGLFNFFFRGKLELTPTGARIFGIADHSVPHTMDADGYPRRNDSQRVFGFTKVRINVRNATPDIVESGTAITIPQIAGGQLPGEIETPRLIAVARYHRDLCYRPDLSSERVRAFPFNTGDIVEPNCTLPVRTNYQEISVSLPLFVNSEADLPRTSSIEKMFDFTLDPIPINATDLFLQVIYVGRLGQEPASIALGTLDISEPTYVAFWNNTDFFYNETANPRWLPSNSLFPRRGLNIGWICAGSPRREVYRFDIATAGFSMGFPPDSGFMRVAMLFPQSGSTGAGNSFFVSGAAQGTSAGLNPIPRSVQTTGQLRQSNRELFPPSLLNFPVTDCGISTSPTPRWCSDPINQRRGFTYGAAIAPLHLVADALNEPTDVGTVAMPNFTTITPRTGGALIYNLGQPFINCPIPPPSTLSPTSLEWLEAQAEQERQAAGE